MPEKDQWYFHLLHECQVEDAQRRMDALKKLNKQGYLHFVEPQFLLDRLNSTSDYLEQSEILSLMRQLKKPLPIDALMAMLADAETTSFFLRSSVAHTLAVAHAEEALDLFFQIVLDQDEHPWLRESMACDLETWGDRLSHELTLALLADPQSAVVSAALDVMCSWPADTIPFALVLPYCSHEKPHVREAALKTLLATEQPDAITPILAALHDSEQTVRAVASHSCISLIEMFGEQIPLDPLVQALCDEYAAVREDLLDALGKVPHLAPLEPVLAALNDPVYFVRCAAIETLGLMPERVPASIHPLLQDLSGSDPSAHVRARATRTLLLAHGMTPPPLRMPTIEINGDDFWA